MTLRPPLLPTAVSSAYLLLERLDLGEGSPQPLVYVGVPVEGLALHDLVRLVACPTAALYGFPPIVSAAAPSHPPCRPACDGPDERLVLVVHSIQLVEIPRQGAVHVHTAVGPSAIVRPAAPGERPQGLGNLREARFGAPAKVMVPPQRHPPQERGQGRQEHAAAVPRPRPRFPPCPEVPAPVERVGQHRPQLLEFLPQRIGPFRHAARGPLPFAVEQERPESAAGDVPRHHGEVPSVKLKSRGVLRDELPGTVQEEEEYGGALVLVALPPSLAVAAAGLEGVTEPQPVLLDQVPEPVEGAVERVEQELREGVTWLVLSHPCEQCSSTGRRRKCTIAAHFQTHPKIRVDVAHPPRPWLVPLAEPQHPLPGELRGGVVARQRGRPVGDLRPPHVPVGLPTLEREEVLDVATPGEGVGVERLVGMDGVPDAGHREADPAAVLPVNRDAVPGRTALVPSVASPCTARGGRGAVPPDARSAVDAPQDGGHGAPQERSADGGGVGGGRLRGAGGAQGGKAAADRARLRRGGGRVGRLALRPVHGAQGHLDA
eukprot:CAMPEP_0194319744 /NCGR_PEP_ID=MMETSP0171-20130528/16168_1 /TAXON_ID=218684 /ORGANISM="Corethron pennatum, Strain L29A3" /LENGTH=545 /DNA_ID=CAMNT_0039077077 /DNA_START=163 /DNA_END=1798 /DNA_ORIENTATION=+